MPRVEARITRRPGDHPPACVETEDLARRFPAQQALTRSYLCTAS